MESQTLKLEGCAETFLLTYHISGFSVVQIFHANQNVSKNASKLKPL